MLSQLPQDVGNLATRVAALACRDLTTQTLNAGSAARKGMFERTAIQKQKRRRGASQAKERTLLTPRLVAKNLHSPPRSLV